MQFYLYRPTYLQFTILLTEVNGFFSIFVI